jgi:hypothetical protein
MSPNLIIVNLPIRLVATSTLAGINLVVWALTLSCNYDKVRAHKTRLIPARVDVTTNRIGKLTMKRFGLIKLG